MQRRNQRTSPRQIASRQTPRRWAAMSTNTYPETAFSRENPPRQGANRSSPATVDAAVEFGRFRVSAAPAAAARRRCSGRARHTRFRSASGPLGGRRLARLQGGPRQPGVAGMSWCRKRTSRFRSPHCARRSARTAMSFAPNSVAATVSPACSARVPRWAGVSARHEQSSGLLPPSPPTQVETRGRDHRTVGNRSGVVSVGASQRPSATETGSNGVVTAMPRRDARWNG